MRPLYASLATAKLRLDDGHAGLWYDKYCDQWRPDGSLSSDGAQSPKLAWIETVTKGASVGSPNLLAETVARLHRLTEARRGSFGIFTTESRFVTGLGRSHPVDNGFAWHPTLGVPYLPGSSIKGLVRAWAQRDAEPRPTQALLDRVFGVAEAPRSAGGVIFLDAIPIAPVKLEADVMTPHYAGWSPDEPPGDWREPVPVPFLTVAPRTSFFFSLLPRETAPGELEDVLGWLRGALLGAGAGAKTAVGYGRFAYDEAGTAAQRGELEKQRLALEQAARRARLEGTPEGRWQLELERKPEAEILELVRRNLEAHPLDRGEQRAFARAVAALDYMVLWRKGETKDRSIRTGRDKVKARARLVDAVAAEADSTPAG